MYNYSVLRIANLASCRETPDNSDVYCVRVTNYDECGIKGIQNPSTCESRCHLIPEKWCEVDGFISYQTCVGRSIQYINRTLIRNVCRP